MKPIKAVMTCIFLLAVTTGRSQMLGIGGNIPTEKLDVSGKVKATAIILNNGGSQYDYLVKNTVTGEVGFKKPMGALGLNYIICTHGNFPPNQGGGNPAPGAMISEIKLFAGNIAPSGWAFCDGSIVSISQNTALFAIIGTTYGGNGQSTFALPDLRAAMIVGSGTSPAGYHWDPGEEHY